MSVREHYESLLARRYTWMLGDLEARTEIERARLAALGLPRAGRAIDLGCGSGLHALALARLGLAPVRAVDLSPTLLGELRSRASGLPIETLEADLLDALRADPGDLAVVACLGDTLPHLVDRDAVDTLLAVAAERLAPDGRLVLGFRDLRTPRTGTDRFVPVRADDDAILTCFLEHQGDRVIVHDVLHERGPEGWRMQVSAYPKLALDETEVCARTERAGLAVRHRATDRGLVTIVAQC